MTSPSIASNRTSIRPYVAPSWLPGGHAQTIYPFVLPRPEIPVRRERIDTPDGDFWDVDWIDAPFARAGVPTLILFHGLEGSSGSHYARALMAEVCAQGWRGVIPHFRGCGGEANLRPRAYHSGDHSEIGAMLEALKIRIAALDASSPCHAVGVSLGGSALLNWLGRAGDSARSHLVAAAAVSAPIDLTQAGAAIDRGLNRIYARHFLQTLRPKGLSLAARFPGILDADKVRRARSMYEFDDAVTAPLHGFDSASDYWHRASAKPWLVKIVLPTLVLNARNDPFVPACSLPAAGEASIAVVLEQPATGGHVGFLSGPFPGNLRWLPRRLLQFFRTQIR